MHVLHTTLNCTGYSHSKEVLLLSSLLGTDTLFPFIPTLDKKIYSIFNVNYFNL